MRARRSNVRNNVNEKYIRIVNAKEEKAQNEGRDDLEGDEENVFVLFAALCKGGDPRDPPPQAVALLIGQC